MYLLSATEDNQYTHPEMGHSHIKDIKKTQWDLEYNITRRSA